MNADLTVAVDRRQRWFVAALVTLFVGLSVQHSLKVLRPTRDGTLTAGAVARWKPQIEEMLAGRDIWAKHNYPNPPVMALLLAPFALLPPLGCALAWFYVKVGLTFLTLAWVFRLVESPERPFPAWAKAVTILLSLRPVLGDLSHGNVNLFILFLVVAALTAFARGRDLVAGVALGLAVACKVTPALFLPYLVWKRAWRALAGTALGLLLFLVVVPSAFLGVRQNAEGLANWYRGMVLPYASGAFVTSEHNNQSLPGLAYRLLTTNPSFSTFEEEDDHYVPTEYHTLVDLGPGVAKAVVKGGMLLFALAVVWSCRTPTTPRGGWRLAAECSLVVVGMLLFSERTWKHHCVTLVLPFAVLVYALAALDLSRTMRNAVVACLTAVTLLIASTSTGLLPDRAAKLAQVYGAYVWAFGLLTAALVALLRSDARVAAEAE